MIFHIMVFGSFSLPNYNAIMDGIDMDIAGGTEATTILYLLRRYESLWTTIQKETI